MSLKVKNVDRRKLIDAANAKKAEKRGKTESNRDVYPSPRS